MLFGFQGNWSGIWTEEDILGLLLGSLLSIWLEMTESLEELRDAITRVGGVSFWILGSKLYGTEFQSGLCMRGVYMD